jgi:hypothetical protein
MSAGIQAWRDRIPVFTTFIGGSKRSTANFSFSPGPMVVPLFAGSGFFNWHCVRGRLNVGKGPLAPMTVV